ncbi:MAG TPA: MarR family transcriptional regulator [Anaerolineales bacterium]|nr:MarR family transcriptional regulator [Anaerolineales bacterium]
MNPHPEPGQLERLLAEICRLRHRRVHAFLRSLGLHKGQPSLLRALWEQEGLTHTDLARRLCVQPATITKMVSRMEKAGFLERRPDPSDQRISRVYLTPSGRAIQEDVERIWEVLERETFAGFGEEERVLLARLLRRMRENLLQVTEDSR